MSKLEQRLKRKIWKSRRLNFKKINNRKKLTRYFNESKYAKKNGFKRYQSYLNSEEWKKKAKDYKERFPICEYCRKNKSNQVHHRNYQNVGNEKYWDIISVCTKCHEQKHKIKWK